MVYRTQREELKMSLGQNIKNIRKAKSLSIMGLRQLTGLSKSTISDLENDKSSPTAETLQKIATALQVPIEEFFKERQDLSYFWNEAENIIENDFDKTLYSEQLDKDVIFKENSIEKVKVLSPNIPQIPEEFTDPIEARTYIKMHKIFGSEGFDESRMSDEDILNFANELLQQMKLVGYKYKK